MVLGPGLEIAISEELDLNKVKYEFEKIKLKYTVPEKVHTYTPDFYLKEKDFFIETKRFVHISRQKKMRFIKEQHPELDIRFIFSNSKQKRISKKVKQHTECGVKNTDLRIDADKHIPIEY